VFLIPDGCAIGRRPSKHLICLSSEQVSSGHAWIELRDSEWWLSDLGSANGTFVNDRRVMSSPLRSGDVLRCGSVPLRFEVSPIGRPAPLAGLLYFSTDGQRQTAPLRPEGAVLGSFLGSTVYGADESICRLHCLVYADDGNWTVMPTTARFETKLNGHTRRDSRDAAAAGRCHPVWGAAGALRTLVYQGAAAQHRTATGPATPVSVRDGPAVGSRGVSADQLGIVDAIGSVGTFYQHQGAADVSRSQPSAGGDRDSSVGRLPRSSAGVPGQVGRSDGARASGDDCFAGKVAGSSRISAARVRRSSTISSSFRTSPKSCTTATPCAIAR
jgi:hypothetical protein